MYMNRSQLTKGLIIIGVGVVVLLLAGELLSIDPNSLALRIPSIIIRFLYYILILIGFMLSIFSFLPKEN